MGTKRAWALISAPVLALILLGQAVAVASGTDPWSARVAVIRFEGDRAAACVDSAMTVSWGPTGPPTTPGLISVSQLALAVADDASAGPRADTLFRRDIAMDRWSLMLLFLLDNRIPIEDVRDPGSPATLNPPTSPPMTSEQARTAMAELFGAEFVALQRRSTQSCDAVARPVLGSCVLGFSATAPTGTTVRWTGVAKHYSVRAVVDSDEALKGCLASRGTWKPSDLNDPEVARAIARERLTDVMRQVEAL